MTDVDNIRAEEKSKGGIKYELVLQEPAVNDAPTKILSSPPKNMSVEEIEQKLKAAEERRQMIEAQKASQFLEKKTKLEEASQKRQEFNNNFIQSTKETLEQKMEAIKENRDARMKALQEKLKEHERHAEEVRLSKLQSANETTDKDTANDGVVHHGSP